MATNGLEIKVGADVGDAIKGLESLSDAAKSTSLTWKEFVGQRMGQYMKDFGGHGPAIKKIAEEWSAYKESLRGVAAATANIPTATAKLIPPIKAVGDQLKKIPGSTNQASFALMNFGRVVQDAPFGIMGVANNIDPLLESFRRLKESTGSTGAAFKALLGTLAGPAGIAIAVSAVTSALIAFGPQIKSALSSTGEFAAAIKEAADGTGESAVRMFALVNAVKSGKLSVDELKSAQNELVKENPKFAEAFDKSKVNVEKLNGALKDTVDRILNTIKASAATKILSKEFEAIAEQILNEGKNLTKLQQIYAGVGGRFAGGTGKKFAEGNLKSANNALADFGKRVDEVFGKLKVSPDITKPFVAKPETLKKIKDINDELGKLNKIGLGTETRSQREIAALEEKIRLQEELNRLTAEVARNAPKRLPGTSLGIKDDPLAAKSSLRILDSSALDQLQGLDKINEKLLNTKDLINNGINTGIDTFFNAVANNQDPFKALAQSAQRLVVELGAAVVKALILKAISTAIGAPGADKAIGAGGGILKLLLRGNDAQLQLARGALNGI